MKTWSTLFLGLGSVCPVFLYVPQTYMYVSIVYSCSPAHWAPVRASNGKSSGKKSCWLPGRVLVEKSQNIHMPSHLFHLPTHTGGWMMSSGPIAPERQLPGFHPPPVCIIHAARG